MPLFFQQNINENTSIGIWEILEEESFFLESAIVQREISHPEKRKQHLAGRYILKTICPEFPLTDIKIAETRKPFIPDDPFHFSISHSGKYAAAIASSSNRVGVDVEVYTQRVMKVLHKFLKDDEQALLDHHTSEPYILETMLWSVKESVFKWHGSGNVDFKEHISVNAIEKCNDGIDYMVTVSFNENTLEVKGICFDEFCLTWVD